MAPNDTQIASVISQDLAWARHHLFLLVAVVVLVAGSVYGVVSLIAKDRHETFLQEQAILQSMQKQNEQAQKQNELNQAQAKAQIDALVQQNGLLAQQNATLAAAISSRDAQLLKDREQIKTLPPPQLATKWGESANEPAPVIATSGDFLVPLPLAQKSVDALISVPILEKDKADLNTQLVTETQIATNNEQKYENENKALMSEISAHTSDNTTCKQNVETLNVKVSDLKAAARKRNIIIAVVSTVLGFGLGRR